MSFITGNKAFPKFDSFHAHCAMTVKFETNCLTVFNKMKDAAEEWHPEPKAGGIYALWDSVEEEQIWVTRTTPTKHYVDDVIFDYFGNPADFETSGCTVQAKSRSQTMSYYDYDTNYCNMWNVLSVVDGEAALKGVKTSDCKWVPKDPATTCAKY